MSLNVLVPCRGVGGGNAGHDGAESSLLHSVQYVPLEVLVRVPLCLGDAGLGVLSWIGLACTWGSS